jgi:hypothetical protein
MGRLVLQVTFTEGSGIRHLGPKPQISTTTSLDRLWASHTLVSAATGATVEFSVQPGGFGMNRQFVLLASASGTRPGIFLPPFFTLPLNADALFYVTLTGALNGSLPELVGRTSNLGVAATAVRFPPGMYSLPVGIDVAFAYALVNPVTMTGGPVSFRITP